MRHHAAGIAALLFGAVVATTAVAQDANVDQEKADGKERESVQYDSPDQMIDHLKDGKTAPQAVLAIAEYAEQGRSDRKDMADRLLKISRSGEHLVQRGWSIAALAGIGGSDIDEALLNIHADKQQPKLVRTWAAAARVSMVKSVPALVEKAQLISEFPALGRPIGLRLVAELNADQDNVSPADILAITQRVPQLNQALAPAIMAFGPQALAEVMLTHGDQDTRRLAAGYLATMGSHGAESVPQAVIDGVKFDASAGSVPWNGGPLFIPGLSWKQDEARALVGNLIRWLVWLDENGDANNATQQIHNNIRSLGLANAAGYQSPSWNEIDARAWVRAWHRAMGDEEIEKLFSDLDLPRNHWGILKSD